MALSLFGMRHAYRSKGDNLSLTPSKIVKHLKTYLPKFTNAFTETITVVSATMGINNELTITVTGHGFSPGNKIVIIGGTTRNTLLTATLEPDDTVTFTTTSDHDQTRPQYYNDTLNLTLAGFGSVWDGEHPIIDVENRRSFNLDLPVGETLAPTIDGNQYLIDKVITGVFPIATVPTVDTFTIDLSTYPEMPQGIVDNLELISNLRIAAAANFQRAQAAYSKQGGTDAYLFVIMTDLDVSKEKDTLNDGVATISKGDNWKLTMLQQFSTSVFIPTVNDITGTIAQESVYSEINTALLKSLFGVQFVPESYADMRTVPFGNGPGEYNSAYYVHVWDWQTPYAISRTEAFNETFDTAFRDIEEDLQLFGDENAEMLLNIDLDDEPL